MRSLLCCIVGEKKVLYKQEKEKKEKEELFTSVLRLVSTGREREFSKQVFKGHRGGGGGL